MKKCIEKCHKFAKWPMIWKREEVDDMNREFDS